MSQRDRDYDEILRRALHAAANSVEPAEDGLERIRARLTTPYPMPLAWVMAGCSQLARYAVGAPQSALAWLETVLGGVRERFRAAQPGLPPGRRLAWLRPAVAAAIAAVVVIAGALALTPLPQQAISQTAAFVRYLENGGSAGGTAAPGAAARRGRSRWRRSRAEPGASASGTAPMRRSHAGSYQLRGKPGHQPEQHHLPEPGR